MGLDTKSEVSEIEGVIDTDGSTKAAATREAQGNWDTLDGGTYTIQAADTEEALPSNAVPDGVTVLVHAEEGNTGKVLVGPSGVVTFPLEKATDHYTTNVANIDEIFVEAPNAGDSIVFHFEVDN